MFALFATFCDIITYDLENEGRDLEIKDFDELDENWQMNLFCQCAYVCQNWRF